MFSKLPCVYRVWVCGCVGVGALSCVLCCVSVCACVCMFLFGYALPLFPGAQQQTDYTQHISVSAGMAAVPVCLPSQPARPVLIGIT